MTELPVLPALEGFFTGVYGAEVSDAKRYMCVAFRKPGAPMIERYFSWPDELPKALTLAVTLTLAESQGSRGADVYYCVSLLTAKKRNRDFLDETHCIWADLDDTPPNSLTLEPTFLIESSPGRYQGIWTLDEPFPFSTAEDFSRRIYHAHKQDGADATWDATRLLRFPNTLNMKYTVQTAIGETHPIVSITTQKSLGYTLDEVDQAYPISISTGPGASQSETVDYSQVEDVGTAEEILHRHHREIGQDVLDLFYDDDQQFSDWSKRLWALEKSLFETGLDIYEVFVVARDSACNKYRRDGRPEADLWKEIVRARDSTERQSDMVLTTTEIEEIDLLTPEEISAVVEQPPSFIERYKEWAVSRTDAPQEFHTGGALMALSTALSDRLVVGTKFGDVRPNLWIILLSDSTIARKTTSMRLSLEISDGAGVDSLLATDGSIEGLLTELSARDNLPSVFVRDEFTSLVAGVKKKDYMAGMLTDLCGLYDGGRVKRRLRKDVIEIRKPIFLLFAGGVETKMLELLSHEDITSGFIPRFLPIFGTTSVSELDLIGKRRTRSFKAKDDLVAELQEIVAAVSTDKPIIRVPGMRESVGVAPPIEVELSDESWDRLKEAQRYLLEMADNHDSRDLLLPCTERLIVNILKVASLIAASRMRPVHEGVMTIEYDDLMMALYYGRSWLDHLLRIVTRVGRDPFDGKTHQVLDYITKQGERGINRAAILRNFRLSARDAEEILKTLTERDEIINEGGSDNTGRGGILKATKYARTAKQIRLTAPLKIRRTHHARSNP